MIAKKILDIWGGLCRRITQLEREHAVYGDNFAGWLNARIALADPRDTWGNNQIIGGKWCEPYNGWLSENPEDGPGEMGYPELYKKLYETEREAA